MKIRFRIHPAGAAVFAAAFLFADTHDALASAAALFLHEAGHLLAMCFCGMKECSIELTPFGGMADVRSFDMYSPMKKAVVAASGVAVSAVCAFCVQRFRNGHLFIQSFYMGNISLALMNVMPTWPLDGARVWTAVASFFGCENSVKKLLVYFSYAAGIALAALGLYGVWNGIMNPSLLVAGPYLCYAAGVERFHEKLRRLNAISEKLHYRSSIPVEIHATAAQDQNELKILFLKRHQYGRYLLLLQVDPSSGKIRKYWTENALLQDILDDGMNCRNAKVDKNRGL